MREGEVFSLKSWMAEHGISKIPVLTRFAVLPRESVALLIGTPPNTPSLDHQSSIVALEPYQIESLVRDLNLALRDLREKGDMDQ